MIQEAQYMNTLLQHLIDLLDIPPSHYEQAVKRYESLGVWLHRDQSTVAKFDPSIYPQGSFRYGTVIRPLSKAEEYDLDLVCQLELTKQALAQKQLKELVGEEIKAYAEAHSFKEPVEEKKRCWRLNYADGVSFHMDILSAIPDDEAFRAALVTAGVSKKLADEAIAITDRKHAKYEVIDSDWPRSNPRGFAKWFDARMRVVAEMQLQKLVANQVYASVDDVPAYEWKTPLQRCIQILKRHRDMMFRKDSDGKPISMIITTLAARAYRGETELYPALKNIIDEMPGLVRDTAPRVPNPVNPAEDFADKWASEPKLEQNFWSWQRQIKADLAHLAEGMSRSDLEKSIAEKFNLNMREEQLAVLFAARATQPSETRTPPRVQIQAAPKPWNRND